MLLICSKFDDTFSIVPLLYVDKSDRELIKDVENAELLLVDPYTAAELTSELAA